MTFFHHPSRNLKALGVMYGALAQWSYPRLVCKVPWSWRPAFQVILSDRIKKKKKIICRIFLSLVFFFPLNNLEGKKKKKEGNGKFLRCWRTRDNFRPEEHTWGWHKQDLDAFPPGWITHPSIQPRLHHSYVCCYALVPYSSSWKSLVLAKAFVNSLIAVCKCDCRLWCFPASLCVFRSNSANTMPVRTAVTEEFCCPFVEI